MSLIIFVHLHSTVTLCYYLINNPLTKVNFIAKCINNPYERSYQNLLPVSLLDLFLGAWHEDHIVNLAKGPDQVSNFLFWSILWDACKKNQSICHRWVLGGLSHYFLLLLCWWRLDGLEKKRNTFEVSFRTNPVSVNQRQVNARYLTVTLYSQWCGWAWQKFWNDSTKTYSLLCGTGIMLYLSSHFNRIFSSTVHEMSHWPPKTLPK